MTENFLSHLEANASCNEAVADEYRKLAHAEMLDQAMRAARVLRDQYGRDGLIVVKATPSIDFIVTLIGTLYSGNTPVPIDPQLPDHPLDGILRTCKVRTVLEPLSSHAYVGLEPLSEADPARPALVMFTSGTTGSPKGVIMTHENLVSSCSAVSDYLGYREAASTVAVLPLYYAYGLISQVLCQLFVGGYVRLMAGLRNPLAVIRTIENEDIKSFCGVPSTFLTLAKFSRLTRVQLPSVKVVCSAGAAFDTSLQQPIRAMFPNAKVFNNYGMTEACPRLAFVSDSDPRFVEGSSLRAMAGVDTRIIDPKNHESLPDGEIGVLAVRGKNISPGYLGDEERTREAFTRDGYLITGDLACIDSGYVKLFGRVDDIFNVAGEKVSPLEIEAALNRLPMVESAAVRGIQDPTRGAAPVAFLVLRDAVSKGELDAALAAELTPIKVPVAYYAVSEIPMTSNGKIQRRMLEIDGPTVLRRLS